MGEIQLLGMTHYPPFGWVDASMGGLMTKILSDPDIPASEKDPANWPGPMQAEWGNDAGTAAAAGHRALLTDGFDRVRAELDNFDPDVVVIWGDDQYENFREDVIPAFSVLAYQDRIVRPYNTHVAKMAPKFWEDEPDDLERTVRGAPDAAKELVSSLLADEFDVSYSYEPLHDVELPHAFLNTVLFLDHRRAGFDWPIICVPINCYGSKVIAARGSWRPIGQRFDLDPPSPTPRRLMDMGAAIARHFRQSDLRVSLVASSSWSHAFLTDSTWRLRPDSPADKALYTAMLESDYDTWAATTTAQIVQAGQQEVLNWFALMGAARELDASLRWSDFVETWVFNSNKVFAAWEPTT